MVSLPRGPLPKRPPAPPPRRPPSDPDEVPTGEASPTMAEPTLAEPEAPPTIAESPLTTELPTREVNVERDMPTIVGSFAASQGPQPTAPMSEDAETVVEPGSQSRGPSRRPGTTMPPRSPGRRPVLGESEARQAVREHHRNSDSEIVLDED